MVTSVPGQRRSFLQSIWKGAGQDRNKSLHLTGKPKKNITTVTNHWWVLAKVKPEWMKHLQLLNVYHTLQPMPGLQHKNATGGRYCTESKWNKMHIAIKQNWLLNSMVKMIPNPTTLQNSFSPTFQDKMNRFPWLISSREIPMLAFNRLQLHWKQRQRNKFKSVDTNNLRAKQANKHLWTVVRSLRKTVQIFSASLLTFVPWYFDFPWLSLIFLCLPDFGM